MSRINNFNHPENTPNHFINEKTKKLFLLLSLTGTMMLFHLCSLDRIYIYGTCETYSLLQIPVIIGACVGGPTIGLTLSITYGLLDITYASFSMELTDVLNSPFAISNIHGYNLHGNFISLIMCFLPKIILALTSSLIFKHLKNRGNSLWQLILSVICTFLAILSSYIASTGLFNFVFINYLSVVPHYEGFVTIVNTSAALALLQKMLANLIIDPIAIFAIKNIAHFD